MKAQTQLPFKPPRLQQLVASMPGASWRTGEPRDREGGKELQKPRSNFEPAWHCVAVAPKQALLTLFPILDGRSRRQLL